MRENVLPGGGQVDTRKCCDENQEIYFGFGLHRIIRECRVQAGRPYLPRAPATSNTTILGSDAISK
jgi:hypothetical protein